jgi:hypothetical protein
MRRRGILAEREGAMASIVVRVIAASLLFWAMARHPYSYYTLLRWVTCIVAGYTAYLAAKQKKIPWAWLLAAVAVLFNPLSPIHLRRDVWTILDPLTAVLLLVSIWAINRPKAPPTA